MKKKLSKSSILLVIALLVNIAAGVLYVGVYRTIAKLNKRVAEVAVSIEEQREDKLAERALRDILTSTEEDRGKIDEYLLEDDDVVQFLETIEGFGPVSNTRVITSSVNIDDSAENKKTGFLLLHINAFGTFENILHFVSLIENLPHKVHIDKLTLSVAGQEPVDPKSKAPKVQSWQTNFELRVVKLK